MFFSLQLESLEKAKASLEELLSASEAQLRSSQAEKEALLNDAVMKEQRLKLLESRQDSLPGKLSDSASKHKY